LSNSEIVCPLVLLTHTRSLASNAVPKPGPSMPPPVNPVVIGESGRPFGANFDRLPFHKSSCPCQPTRKLAPTQALPSLSNITFAPLALPPPVNLRGKTQALGAELK
jgi:hypothetical protein